MDKLLEKICREDVELLGYMSKIHRTNEAMGMFLGIMIDVLKPCYKKLEIEPPNAINIIMSPIYGDLVGDDKVLVRMYSDRKIEIWNSDENLKKLCEEMVSMTDGNFRIYPKGALKYLF